MEKFSGERNCDVLILMGMKELETGGIRRDIAMVPIRESAFAKKIVEKLCRENREYLKLVDKNSDLLSGRLFEQQNVKVSRKQILPIIQKVLDCT